MGPSREGPGFVALEGGDARVEIVPERGGLVRALEAFGRDWLLRAGDAPLKSGQHPWYGAGWQECAPSAGGGTVPEWVKGLGGTTLSAGGVTRAQVPETTLRTDREGHTCTCRWAGERLPWSLERTILLRPDGGVEARYEAQATGRDRVPFLWSAWLTFPLTSKTRLRVGDGGRLRVASVAGAALVDGREAHRQWPRIGLDKRTRDLNAPHALPRAAQLAAWVDVPAQKSVVQVIEDGARLTITLAGGVPQLGVMVDRLGTKHPKRRGLLRRSGVPTLTLVPSLGAPDRYDDALGSWQSIAWLVPGEPRRWTMSIRGGAA